MHFRWGSQARSELDSPVHLRYPLCIRPPNPRICEIRPFFADPAAKTGDPPGARFLPQQFPRNCKSRSTKFRNGFMFVFIFTSQIHPQKIVCVRRRRTLQHTNNLRPPQADEMSKTTLRSNTKICFTKPRRLGKFSPQGSFKEALSSQGTTTFGMRGTKQGPKWLSSPGREERARRNRNLSAELKSTLRITPHCLIPARRRRPRRDVSKWH